MNIGFSEDDCTMEWVAWIGVYACWLSLMGGSPAAEQRLAECAVDDPTDARLQVHVPDPQESLLAAAPAAPATGPARSVVGLGEGSFWEIWKRDIRRFPEELWQDAQRLANTRDAVILLVAGGAAITVHETLDDDIEEDFHRHGNRWGKFQDWMGAIGNPGHHFAAAAALYWYGIQARDETLYDCSKTLTNTLAITGLSVIAGQLLSNGHAPNGEWGTFPSGHAASSVAVATVLNEYYGPWAGLPAYALSGLVAWERIDDGEHYLSDVVFGAALGYVVASTVAHGRHLQLLGMEVTPFIDVNTGANGIALQKRF